MHLVLSVIPDSQTCALSNYLGPGTLKDLWHARLTIFKPKFQVHHHAARNMFARTSLWKEPQTSSARVIDSGRLPHHNGSLNTCQCTSCWNRGRCLAIIRANLHTHNPDRTHEPEKDSQVLPNRGMSGTYLRFCFSCCGFILSNIFFWKECIPETPCFIIIFPVKMKKCSCGDKSPTFFDTTALPGVNPHQETCWMHRPRHLWKQQKRYVVWRCQLTQWLGWNNDVLLGKMFSLF